MMRALLLTAAVLASALRTASGHPGAGPGATAGPDAPDATERRVAIRGVEVYGTRPLRETGVRQTRIDSAVLREHVALSMADVLTYNSAIFVKNYGRATLSTVSFRGTSPSHTQVTWNGMRINSPMLDMTDFSMIPAYLVDRAQLLHGASSIGETGGGLGGAVKLATAPAPTRGWGLHYVQGIGSFTTFDEFLRLDYGGERWQSTTRLAVSTSRNDYRFRNRDKKENIHDEEHRIIGQYHPTERNRSGAFRDIHLQQGLYRTTRGGDRLGLDLWYVNSDRELPLLTVDYGEGAAFENRQREHTLRGVASWRRLSDGWRAEARGGYIHTWTAYDYRRDKGNGELQPMTRSRSRIHTLFAQAQGEYAPGSRFQLAADLTLHQHFVRSADRNVIRLDGDRAVVGYDRAEAELSASVTARWRPTERLGMALTLREELNGGRWAPPLPALLADYLLSRRGSVVVKGSLARNYRFPTLNDRYFLPGGNPDLRHESGFSYDAGIACALGRTERWRLKAEASWFDSRIDDWILWLPTPKGFFSPRNIRRVHAYGVELKGRIDAALGGPWRLTADANYSWTPSLDEGEPESDADRSFGKQLVYVPRHSASLAATLSRGTWSLDYKWCWYSRRYTMSSNEPSPTGYLAPYFMNDLSVEKRFALRWADLSVRGAVHNLFDEEYLSVLARPMPGIHFELFIGIRPRWGGR